MWRTGYMRIMKRPLRIWGGVLLALMLSFTSLGMAVARGATTPTGEAVLCTGSGPIAILIDDEGNPVGAPHICPDCALSLFADIGAVPLDLGMATRGEAIGISAPMWSARAQMIKAVARGPPGFA